MCFVGGGGNIVFATALPPSLFCALYCKHQILYKISLSNFYTCLRLRFLDVETNPGPHNPVPAVCRIFCSDVRAWPGTLVAWLWLRLGMIYCCALRLWFRNMCHVSELLVPGFGRPVLLCQGKLHRAPGMAAYIRDCYGAFRQPKSFECGCCEMLVLGFVVWDLTFMYSVFTATQT